MILKLVRIFHCLTLVFAFGNLESHEYTSQAPRVLRNTPLLESDALFVSESKTEFNFLRQKIEELRATLNETLQEEFSRGPSANPCSFAEASRIELNKRYHEIFLLLSLSRQEKTELVESCHEVSASIAAYWKMVDPEYLAASRTQNHTNFGKIREELEIQKDAAVTRLYDRTRYLGLTDSDGRKIVKRALELNDILSDTRHYGNADFRYAATIHIFLKDLARIFLDHNDLFRLPKGASLLIGEQVVRKLKETRDVLKQTRPEDVGTKPVRDAMTDSRLVFKLLPLFRDPIGDISSAIDLLMADIREELIRLQFSREELETCFIKRMRTRFEKVWYSIDWVLQYVNFVYMQSGGRALSNETADFLVAGYIFRFADWADSVVKWNVDSIEARLLLFWVRSLLGELSSSEVFKHVRIPKLDIANEL